MKNKILPLLSFLGLLIAIAVIVIGNKELTPPPPAAQASVSPYKEFIAGAGIIEPSTENIYIGTPVPGIISNIYIKLDQKVKQGAPLFKIETRDLEAELSPALAKVDEKKAILGRTKVDFKIAKKSMDSVSKELISERKFEVDIAKYILKSAEAEVNRLKIEIDRRRIIAPVTGNILQLKIHLGEFATDGTINKQPLLILGNTDNLYARVDIDEYDAWRFKKNQPAIAFIRGRPNIKFSLKFIRIEPYIIPKKSLTGNSTERTDTRVLQVIYSFDKKINNLYVGEQIDVYIKAPVLKDK